MTKSTEPPHLQNMLDHSVKLPAHSFYADVNIRTGFWWHPITAPHMISVSSFKQPILSQMFLWCYILFTCGNGTENT